MSDKQDDNNRETKIKFLVTELFKHMTLIGNHKSMSGSDKKKWVLNRLKEELNFPDVFEPLLNEFIDYIVLVDRRQIIVNQKNDESKKEGNKFFIW